MTTSRLRLHRLIVGTRGSLLARTQTGTVLRALREAHPSIEIEERIITTQGDRQTSQALPEIGGKGLFTKEIEDALLSGEIHLAVHSLKDLPTALPEGLAISAIPARENPFDALVSKDDAKLADLPQGARVGTGSLRRMAQLLAVRPDLRVEPIRGNVDTRIRKLRSDEWDAIVVAAAGLARLGRLDEASEIFSPDVMLPAVGQGALAIETRVDDPEVLRFVASIHDEATARTVTAERAFLDALGGGCHVPIAGYATDDGGILTLRGWVARPDGGRIVKATLSGSDPEALGIALASELRDLGAEFPAAAGGRQ